MSKTIKLCQVYLRPEGFYVFEVANTQYGGIILPKAVKLTAHATPTELGKTIRETLARLPDGEAEVDLASSGKAHREYLKELGFRSPGHFESKASSVTVIRIVGGLEIVAYKRADEGGFLAEKPVVIPLDYSDLTLGDAVIQKLKIQI